MLITSGVGFAFHAATICAAFKSSVMAKIVQTLTRASSEYEEDVAQSLVRDLDAVLEKLNTTFQEELKQEIEARSFFLN